jgi:hypothetical protein
MFNFKLKMIMNKSELLQGLSIEELQERNEFAALSAEEAQCVICSC